MLGELNESIRVNKFVYRIAFTSAIRTTAPSIATRKLYMLKPLTPPLPKEFIIHPPSDAPTMPKMISNTKPSLVPITTEANQPTMAPKMIHIRILIRVLLKLYYHSPSRYMVCNVVYFLACYEYVDIALYSNDSIIATRAPVFLHISSHLLFV